MTCPLAASVNEPARPPSRPRDSRTATWNPRCGERGGGCEAGQARADNDNPVAHAEVRSVSPT